MNVSDAASTFLAVRPQVRVPVVARTALLAVKERLLIGANEAHELANGTIHTAE